MVKYKGHYWRDDKGQFAAAITVARQLHVPVAEVSTFHRKPIKGGVYVEVTAVARVKLTTKKGAARYVEGLKRYVLKNPRDSTIKAARRRAKDWVIKHVDAKIKRAKVTKAARKNIKVTTRRVVGTEVRRRKKKGKHDENIEVRDYEEWDARNDGEEIGRTN